MAPVKMRIHCHVRTGISFIEHWMPRRIPITVSWTWCVVCCPKVATCIRPTTGVQLPYWNTRTPNSSGRDAANLCLPSKLEAAGARKPQPSYGCWPKQKPEPSQPGSRPHSRMPWSTGGPPRITHAAMSAYAASLLEFDCFGSTVSRQPRPGPHLRSNGLNLALSPCTSGAGI